MHMTLGKSGSMFPRLAVYRSSYWGCAKMYLARFQHATPMLRIIGSINVKTCPVHYIVFHIQCYQCFCLIEVAIFVHATLRAVLLPLCKISTMKYWKSQSRRSSSVLLTRIHMLYQQSGRPNFQTINISFVRQITNYIYNSSFMKHYLVDPLM